MQSNKTSLRTPRGAAADVAGQLPDSNTAAPVAKARKTAASASPKKTAKTAAPAKRHRTTANAVGDVVAAPVQRAAQVEVGEVATTPKAMAAASGAGMGSFHSDAVGSVGNMTEPAPASEKAGRTSATLDDIARLAHSYWSKRGYQHGSHEEDWLRAERELKSRR